MAQVENYNIFVYWPKRKKCRAIENSSKKNANFQVLGTHFGQVTAQLALQGKYGEARTNAYAKKKLLKRTAKTETDMNCYNEWKSEISSADRVMAIQQKLEKKKGRYYSDDEGDESEDEGVEKETKKKLKREKVSKMRSTERNDTTSNTLYRLNRYKQQKPKE